MTRKHRCRLQSPKRANLSPTGLFLLILSVVIRHRVYIQYETLTVYLLAMSYDAISIIRDIILESLSPLTYYYADLSSSAPTIHALCRPNSRLCLDQLILSHEVG